MAIRTSVLLVCAFWLAASAALGGGQTLDSLIRLALQANPDLQAAGHRQISALHQGRATGTLERCRIRSLQLQQSICQEDRSVSTRRR